MRSRIVEALANDGFLLDHETEEYILGQDAPLQFARQVISQMVHRPLVVTMRDVRTVVRVETPRLTSLPRPMASGKRRIGEVEVLRDITSHSECLASVEGFARYFQDRYASLRQILLRRMELAGAQTIQRVLDPNRTSDSNKEIKVIGMVNEVRTTRSGEMILDIEDDTARCTVMVPKDHKLIQDSVLQDEVVGIIGKLTQKDRKIILKKLVRPDVPIRSGMEENDSTTQVAFMSDVHIGSNTFLEERWRNMISWLKDEAEDLNLQYIVIPGDCVDGVGIFPGQEEELLIEDIIDQYKALAEHLKEVPDNIRIVMQPGNHDMVRPAEPQPALNGEVSRLFDSNIMQIGNPAYLRIEGRTILSYHGKSFDDMVNGIKGLSYSQPLKAMEEMLKRRHLAPTYGGKTPFAPERRDYLVIDEVPDIFVTGHVHGAGVSSYNGIRLINASTWQDQTSFQKMHNFVPDPAKLTLVNLGTGKPSLAAF
ncbi:MAG TPA: DNA-directed DNA polymerase II small subunit [Methanomassiliicoccales archaeon]|nr:DNA-directed DNA polymerase II small subunit [Methanomassiliicoccales archaeon]